ncbi:hypothetical protein [Methanomethylophilus alvi]|uniref:hypothetical protein n=1 Tax=Methanomethylophilus alvi TaxID=1291540 RepID=UPI0037DDA594
MGQERLRPEESTPTLLTLSVTYGDTYTDNTPSPYLLFTSHPSSRRCSSARAWHLSRNLV